jgi:hypothetical protein
VTFGLASEFNLHGAAEFASGKHLGQMALHAAVGCAQSSAAGGSCKSGAIGSGVSAFASPGLNGLGKEGKLVASSVIGGIASRLSGGRFENGAITAAFGYLFNEAADRLVDKALDQTPRHFYSSDFVVGPDSDPASWEAGSHAIHSWNAPHWPGGLEVGETRVVNLWGGNPVRQVSYGPYLVTNQTLDGHVYHPGAGQYGGMVTRSVASDSQGNVRVYTIGYGSNPTQINAINNMIFGWTIFQGVNAVNFGIAKSHIFRSRNPIR